MDALIGLGAACLLIRLGLGSYRSGLMRAKNAAGSVLRVFVDLCLATLAFWAIGAAILLQTHNPVFGLNPHLLLLRQGGTAELFFLATLVILGSGIVGGAVDERSRFFPTWWLSILMAGAVIPIGANWAWGGWLAKLGFIDSAGASWLHVSGGVCALVAARAVGPRDGKYHHDGSTSMIPGHNVPIVGLGVLAMLAGWVPYVAGCLIFAGKSSLAGAAATETILAGASAGLVGVLQGHFRFEKPDVLLTVLAFLGGLVAVSAGAGHVGPTGAVFIGAAAGMLVPAAAIWVDLVGHVDDPVNAVAVHGVGGVWGLVATGFLAEGGFVQRLRHTGVQLLGLVAIAGLALVLSSLLFAILKRTTKLRVREADEYDGLDLAEHDIGGYPDFQQNTIKSYHLREA